MQQQIPECPECKSPSVIRIVYALPTSTLYYMRDRGEIVLGGCAVDDSSPKWFCKNCGHKWGKEIEEK